MADLILTEGTVASYSGTSASFTANLCCTKARAEALGCTVTAPSGAASNQLITGCLTTGFIPHELTASISFAKPANPTSVSGSIEKNKIHFYSTTNFGSLNVNVQNQLSFISGTNVLENGSPSLSGSTTLFYQGSTSGYYHFSNSSSDLKITMGLGSPQFLTKGTGLYAFSVADNPSAKILTVKLSVTVT